MRVLLPTIRNPGQIGGTSTHLDMLSRGLEELGHEAKVLYLGAEISSFANRCGVVWPAGLLNRVRRGWGMIYAAEVRGRLLGAATRRELVAGGWDVLNAQEVYSLPYLRRLADEFGMPLVLTLHGYPLYESVSEGYTSASRWGRSYLMRSEMRGLRLADEVVTVDTRLHNHVLKLLPEKSNETSALMNFIDTGAFFPSREGADGLRRKWGVPEDKVVLFCPRRLVKKNGVVYPALALAAMAPPDRARFLLLHAGEGGERQAIEEVVAQAGLQEEVRLLGGRGREEILELYRLCDQVLVPSVHSENVEEATSLAALEAMASGRPLIAGAVGGLAEMVTDGVNGLLVPGGDADALAAAILRLAAAPDLGAGLAAAARAYVVENHSHTRAAAEYAAIYQRAAKPSEPHIAAEPGTSVSVLGFPLHLVSLEQAADWAISCARSASARRAAADHSPGRGRDEAGFRTKLAVSFNPELVMRARGDPLAAEALLGSDLRYADGVGAVWAAGLQGAGSLSRVPGIDLAESILERAAAEGLSVYFLGAEEGVAEEAARCGVESHLGLRVAGFHHGYFGPHEESEVVRAVRESGADILLAGLGAPRQEIFLFRNRDRLGAGVALGVGGSFDVWSGNVRRAPTWSRRAGLEWLYRLLSNPKRVRRQLVLPRFAAAVLAGCDDDYGPGRMRGEKPRLPSERGAVSTNRDGGGG